MSDQKFDLVIREETLANERRTILTPDQVAELTRDGFHIALAHWDDRIYSENDYMRSVQDAGTSENFKIIEPNEWKAGAKYKDSLILGVKEIEDRHAGENDFALSQTYIHFDHSYKGQPGSAKRLSRFYSEPEGAHAVLLDHEYCVDEVGKRTHAFGKSAGYATTAISVLSWAQAVHGDAHELPQFSYDSKQDFFEQNTPYIEQAISKSGYAPKALILGGEKGRSATGARNFIEDLNSYIAEDHRIDVNRWGREKTEDFTMNDGGLRGVEKFDIVINATFSDIPVPAFMNDKTLSRMNDGRARIVGDVTCDTSADKNRIRFSKYRTTDFDDPVQAVSGNVKIVTIDHSPSFFPKEATDDIAEQFFPQIQALLEARKNGAFVPDSSPWARSLKVFEDKMTVPVNAYYAGRELSRGYDLVHMSRERRNGFLNATVPQLKTVTVGLFAQMDELTLEERDTFMFHVAAGLLRIHDQNNLANWHPPLHIAGRAIDLDPMVLEVEAKLNKLIKVEKIYAGDAVQRQKQYHDLIAERLNDTAFVNDLGYEDQSALMQSYAEGDMTPKLQLFLEYTEAATRMVNPVLADQDAARDFEQATFNAHYSGVLSEEFMAQVESILFNDTSAAKYVLEPV